MRLKEYEGKEIFKEHKIKIPKGFLIRNIKEINTSLLKKLKGNKVVIKAEVLVGSRGKAGGIRICEKKDIKTHCKDLFHRKIRGFKVKEILIEEYTKIKHEYYLSIVLNKNKKCLEILFSKKGGIDIETLSKKHPKEITKIFVKNNKFDKKQNIRKN